MGFFVFSETSKFDPILVPTWLHFGTQNAKSIKIHENIDSKRHPKNDRFLDRFFAQVGSMLGPKLGPKSRSKRFQNAPKTLPRRHEDSPRATRAPKIEILSIFGPKIRWDTPPPGLETPSLDQYIQAPPARWRVRSSAARWIRTRPEGAQLRVHVQRRSVSTKAFCSLSVISLSSL